MSNFEIKDSGKRQEFSTGMVRDVTEDKIDYTLALDGPMFKRLAIHLTKGAKKYAKRNWMKAATKEEAERFLESAARHFFLWYEGARSWLDGGPEINQDEDHFVATTFNQNGFERVRQLMSLPNLDYRSPEPGESVGMGEIRTIVPIPVPDDCPF